MKSFQGDEFSKLFQEVALGGFHPRYLKVVKEFETHHANSAQYLEVRGLVRDLISLIHFTNRNWNESFQIDLGLLETTTPKEPASWAIINRLVANPRSAENPDLIRPQLIGYIGLPTSSFYDTIFLVEWYLKFYKDRPVLGVIEEELQKISEQMGLTLDKSLDAELKVNTLVKELRNASKLQHDLINSHGRKPQEEFICDLKRFLSSDVPSFFKADTQSRFHNYLK